MATAAENHTLIKNFFEHVTTAIHVLLLGLTIYLVWVCTSKEITLSLITYHVIFSIVGWIFFMNESVLSMTEYNIFTKFISEAKKGKVHMFLQVIGFGLVLAGFMLIILDNELENRSHFVSAHAIIGLVAISFGVVAYLNSIPLYYHAKFEKLINPNISKLFHVSFGIITFILGAVATITGFYTPWFKYRIDRNYTIIDLCWVITVFTLLWLLISPSLNIYKRIKSMLS